MVPETADPGNLAQHLKRYHFAAPYCRDKVVLDVGSGVGYGAHILAGVTAKAYGIDYDSGAVRYASRTYGSTRLGFLAGDSASLPFKSNVMDVVVSFEVIEHVPDHGRFFEEIRRVLKPDGSFLTSTPNKETTGIFRRKAGFTYDAHVSEMDLATFRKELQTSFTEVRLFGMRLRGNALYALLRALDPWNLRLRVLSSGRQIDRAREKVFGVPAQGVSPEDVVISRWHLRQANHFLAVCRGKRT